MSKPGSPATQERQAFFKQTHIVLWGGVCGRNLHLVDFQRYCSSQGCPALSIKGTSIQQTRIEHPFQSQKQLRKQVHMGKFGATTLERWPSPLQHGQCCLQKEALFLNNCPKKAFLLSSTYDFAVCHCKIWEVLSAACQQPHTTVQRLQGSLTRT